MNLMTSTGDRRSANLRALLCTHLECMLKLSRLWQSGAEGREHL